MNKKVVFSLIVLCIIVFILGMHGGSEYYFRDFCVHKTLNMFFNNGNPEFFKKPNFVSDIQAIAYTIYYFILKQFHIVNNFEEFTQYFGQNNIPTPWGNISFMLPALIINNIFAALGVCFTFLITYLITDKKVLPSFISAFVLATSYCWMNFSHHLAVDMPLAVLCLAVLFFSIYYINNKPKYSRKEIFILGILSGLCFATKYNGLIIIIVPLLTLLMTETDRKKLIYDVLLLLIGTVYTFLITNPYILLKFSHFYWDFRFEYMHAFKIGHFSADDTYSLIFHLFHNFPNATGTVVFICSIVGGVLFCKNKQISQNVKYSIMSFIIMFCFILSCSFLIFQRYILPLVPFTAIFVGYLVHYAIIKSEKSKILRVIVYIGIGAVLLQNVYNAVHFYDIVSHNDTRVLTKEIFKTLELNKDTKVLYSDIFSNPYYVEDFTGEFSHLKDNIIEYLYAANNTSIYILPRADIAMFNNYQILIFDSYTYDRTIQIRKDSKYSDLESQFYMYSPYNKNTIFIMKPDITYYVAQVNPYKINKSFVPFDTLRADWQYRFMRGPFVEIYFKDKCLRDKFIQTCPKYELKCKSLNMDQGYYYQNLFVDRLY